MSKEGRSEKTAVERATADLFLHVYNEFHSTRYEITQLSDAPDVRCEDRETCQFLNLEVCVLEDLPGHAHWRLGRGKKPPGSLGDGSRGHHDVLESLQERLRDKLSKRYGPKTALVVRQISPIWDRDDWARSLPEIPWSELGYGPEIFDCGIWILCSQREEYSGRYDILRIDPEFSTAGS